METGSDRVRAVSPASRAHILCLSGKTENQDRDRRKTIMICGIVDLGSNTIRLSIYQCEDGRAQLLMNRKVTAGLADYVVDGEMSPQGIRVACDVLEEYRTLMDNLRFPRLRVFATASLRNVSNTAEAVTQIQETTGLSVVVLSGTGSDGTNAACVRLDYDFLRSL